MTYNKKNIIIAFVICLLFVFIIILSKSKPKEDRRVIIPQEHFIKNEEKEEEEEENKPRLNYSYSGTISSESETDGPPALLSEEDKLELTKSYTKDNKIIKELKKEWMEKKLKDPNLPPAAVEQFKLRSNPSFANGMKAFDKGDYAASASFFNEILKDNNTTPVSKYFACLKLMDIAKKKKNLDLYFLAARTRVELEEGEDLEIIGINRNNTTKDFIIKLEYTLRAKNDPSYFEKCIEMKLAKIKKESNETPGEKSLDSLKSKDFSPEQSREWAKKLVEKEIEFYSKKYKDLLE